MTGYGLSDGDYVKRMIDTILKIAHNLYIEETKLKK